MEDFYYQIIEIVNPGGKNIPTQTYEIYFFIGLPNEALINHVRSQIPKSVLLCYLYPECTNESEVINILNKYKDGTAKILLLSLSDANLQSKLIMLMEALRPAKMYFSCFDQIKKLVQNQSEEIKKLLDFGFAGIQLLRQSELNRLRCSILNLPLILKDKDSNLSINKQEKVHFPVIICSAGPSILKQLETLKKYQNHAIIIAVGRIVPILYEAGISPEFIVEMDPSVFDYTWKHHNIYPESILVTSFVCHPRIAKRFKKILWYESDCRFVNYLTRILNIPNKHLSFGRSVTVSAIDFAKKIGATHIGLIGNDLCLSDSGRVHTTDITRYSDTDVFEVEGVPDGKVKTTNALLGLKAGVTEYLKNIGNMPKIFNCTYRGAKIEGIKHISLKEFFSSYTNELNKNELIRFSASPRDTSEISDKIREIYKLFSEYQKILQDLTDASRLLYKALFSIHISDTDSGKPQDTSASTNANITPDSDGLTAESKLKAPSYICNSKPNSSEATPKVTNSPTHDLEHYHKLFMKIHAEECNLRTKEYIKFILTPVIEFAENIISEKPSSHLPQALTDVHKLVCGLELKKSLLKDIDTDIRHSLSYYNGNLAKCETSIHTLPDPFKFSAFKKYVINFLSYKNPEFAKALEENMFLNSDEFTVCPHWQALPELILITPCISDIPSLIFGSEKGIAKAEIELNNFLKQSEFNHQNDCIIFIAPLNWTYPVAFIREYGNAELMVIEPFPELLSETANYSIFLHLFQEDTVIICTDSRLPTQEKICLKKIQEWKSKGKRIILFSPKIIKAHPKISEIFDNLKHCI